MALGALAGLATAAAAGFISEHQGGEHPDADIGGFQIHSLFFHQDNPKTPLRRHFLKRRASPTAFPSTTWDGNTNSIPRDLVLALAKLCLLTYPGTAPGEYDVRAAGWAEESSAVLRPFLAEGYLHSGSAQTSAQALNYTYDFGVAIHNEATAAGTLTHKYDPVPTNPSASPPNKKGGAYDETGLAAIEFVNGNNHFLVFRGSYSPGEYENIRMWMTEYAAQKMLVKMERSWSADAGFQWTDEQTNKTGNPEMTRFYYCLATGTFQANWKAAAAELAAKSTLSSESAFKMGTWELSKRMFEQVRSSLPNGASLYLSGHSQGGGRAELLSMWQKKTHNRRVAGVTFASAGAGACTPRGMALTGTSLLSEMDPTVHHEQLVDYVHPLDPWGNNLEEKVGTTRFISAKGDKTDSGYLRCLPLYGKNPLGEILLSSTVLNTCLKETHNINYMIVRLSTAGIVYSNGTTIGGQTYKSTLPNSLCPSGKLFSNVECGVTPPPDVLSTLAAKKPNPYPTSLVRVLVRGATVATPSSFEQGVLGKLEKNWLEGRVDVIWMCPSSACQFTGGLCPTKDSKRLFKGCHRYGGEKPHGRSARTLSGHFPGDAFLDVGLSLANSNDQTATNIELLSAVQSYCTDNPACEASTAEVVPFWEDTGAGVWKAPSSDDDFPVWASLSLLAGSIGLTVLSFFMMWWICGIPNKPEGSPRSGVELPAAAALDVPPHSPNAASETPLDAVAVAG
eukprot:Hpha_TRINITY_DN14106_c0_g1::TRINITY_DN14106_c0_g1_i1::g.10554::m.10554